MATISEIRARLTDAGDYPGRWGNDDIRELLTAIDKMAAALTNHGIKRDLLEHAHYWGTIRDDDDYPERLQNMHDEVAAKVREEFDLD